MKLEMTLASVCGAVSALAGAAMAQPAPGPDGQTAFNNACRTCHTTKVGDNRLGPSLAAVVGRKSGGSAGFQYSSSLGDGKITWDEATLDKFLANPDSVAPGNNMKPFTNISDAGDRKLIIDFLKAQK